MGDVHQMTTTAVKPARPEPYTSKIIKAGALLPDTKLLLAQWDVAAGVSENLARVQRENLFGKTSRARVGDILAVFRQRYLRDQRELAALVALVREGAPASTLDPICYFLSARADPLIADTVLEVLAPAAARGQATIRPRDVTRWLLEQVAAGRTAGAWSEATAERIARGLLATLRDFGLLRGKATKRLAAAHLPLPAFAFIALLLRQTQRSGDKLLHDPAWRLFFLSQPAVERLFLEAHQERLLEYHAAGRVIRIEFPAPTLEEYAHALARRPL